MSKDKIERMDDEQLLTHVTRLSNDASDFIDARLQKNWGEAQKYYFGDKMGNEVEGKSQVISRDVSDAIDWMMPSLMDIFAGDQDVVRFDPRTPEDVQEAEQATDYVNYVFRQKNNGFMVLHNFFKDALMFKVGVVKHYFEEKEEVCTELYTGIDETDLELILSDADTDIIERTDVEDGTLDVKITRLKRSSQVKIENVPPEEFLIDRHAKCVEDATFVGHKRQVTKSDLRELGYEDSLIEDINWNGEVYSRTDDVRLQREQYNGNYTTEFTQVDAGEANEKVWLIEAYVRIDYDGDGLTELRRIVYAGNVLLSNEEWDRIPFATLTPNPIQHSFYGQSVFDMVKDVQEIKTALLRNQLDNMYLVNNGRYVVMEGQVRLEDLKNNKPGGVVREKMQGALRPLDTPALPQGSYEMLGYMDELKTNRTGVSPRTQGLDDKVLNSHTGQGQVNKVMSVAEQRLKLIARIFAETGVTELFKGIYELITKYQNKEDVFKVNGKFITVNPSKWRHNTDLRIIVGMGTKDKDQQMMYLMRIYEVMQGVIGNGGMGILTNETKIYNLLTEMLDNVGYKDTEKFLLDPTSPEGQQGIKRLQEAQSKPSPDEIKAKAQMQKDQAESQQGMLKLQNESRKDSTEAEIKKLELELKQREMSLKEREQALQEDIQDMERDKFEWQKQIQTAEVILEKEAGKSISIGDNKLFKGRNKGEADTGNTGD